MMNHIKYIPIGGHKPLFISKGCSYTQKIMAICVDNTEEAIVEACIACAEKEGVTDLYLIDRRFVLDALREKAVGYKRGKWIKHGNEKECSACEFIYYSNNDEWNYCPNCGAKMYGKEVRNDGHSSGNENCAR